MATSHQQPSFDLGLILPLPEKNDAGVSWEEHERSDRMQTPDALAQALQEALSWKPVDATKESANSLEAHWKSIAERINEAASNLQKRPSNTPASESAKLISENLSMMRLALLESRAGIQNAKELPYVEKAEAQVSLPRSFALALVYLQATGCYFGQQGFSRFVKEVQEKIPVLLSEIWNLKPFLELMLLQQIAEQISRLGSFDEETGTVPNVATSSNAFLALTLNSLSRVNSLDWKTFFQSVSFVESILRTDPCGAYEKMDYESRESYRAAVAELSVKSTLSEAEVARKAIALATAGSKQQPGHTRVRERRSHVGFYLVDAGKAILAKEIGYGEPLTEKIRNFVLRWADLFYLLSIEMITFGVLALVVQRLHVTALGILPIVLLALPAVECAVAAVNLFATRIFPPRKLAKLDFSKGIPNECATVVAVPTLLSSAEQVRQAVRGLEVRFLANRDQNLQFALVTDLPDAAQQFDEKESLVKLCSSLIEELNAEYGPEKKGTFFHFHRRRIFNESEGVWMGWERKRGKLLDFNAFLLRERDSFPVKTGDLSLLNNVRYVITLDLDTQLPPGVGHRLVGTLSHPLNRAVLNPRTHTVVQGYGILQPRVDINLKSTNRSWFAKLLSGDTGIDIYTRAVSDVYQDLFGAGIFTGKGIYEVETFQKILNHRFPNNVVLSHDLIEGEFARTGLVSDIEVVDDYPSHYRAFSGRKHRWIRGDWQILFALMPRIRDFSGEQRRNPLNHMSRWKIVDNLRRSLTECATLFVLLYGWLVLPAAAWRWTLAAMAILLFPAYFPIAVGALTAGKAWFRADFWKSLGSDFVLASYRVFVRLAFLCHQSLIDVDAVLRSIVRMKFTRKRLLQWETAADAEARRGNGLVDMYLKYSWIFTVAVGVLVAALHPQSLPFAAPFLVLWGTAPWVADWLNRAPRGRELKIEERKMLRNATLRTWRFFREFSNARENWLIPDIVQQEPPLVAHRVSPTNLGLLFNARQSAHDLGFLTTAEFVQDSEATFHTVKRMPRSQGHLYNWYENSTLEPVAPLFVSTVDNGNLLCSLWALKQGCLEILNQPLLRNTVWEGIRDHVDLLVEVAQQNNADSKFLGAVSELNKRAAQIVPGELDRLDNLRAFASDVMRVRDLLAQSEVTDEVAWWTKELALRVAAALQSFDNLAPWLDDRYQHAASLSQGDIKRFVAELTLESLPTVYGELCARIQHSDASAQTHTSAQALRNALQHSITYAQELAGRLRGLASAAESMANEMDFSILYDQKKKLFSIGYEDAHGAISKYHYDLLASEARTAVFVAIAKGEVPQETWFQLKRSYRAYKGDDVLLSWSGTMFEYLMPVLWMKAYPTTVLERGVCAAISAQRNFAKENKTPCWGISESSCNQRNPDGHYRYHAFGVPPLALHTDDCSGNVVIAPYASFLALLADPASATKNLRKMKQLGWTSPYGFYEAADFTPGRVGAGHGHEVVRNWMAHHQGMAIVAAANVLCDFSMQRRFHAEPRVAAYERLLHEKPPRALPYEEETETISKSAPALLRHALKPHPGFRGLLPKLLVKGEKQVGATPVAR
jgi:cyclic beta-1,2-glucan synthetase